jgi:hypothetical protein
MEERQILSLSGIESRPSSPQPIAAEKKEPSDTGCAKFNSHKHYGSIEKCICILLNEHFEGMAYILALITDIRL